jgi:hypothetical protein
MLFGYTFYQICSFDTDLKSTITIIMTTVYQKQFQTFKADHPFLCCICRSLSSFCWSLCCPSFFDLRILFTPLVTANSNFLIRYRQLSVIFDHHHRFGSCLPSIVNGWSALNETESVNRRKTDNTMTNRKRTMIYKYNTEN